MKYYFIDTKLLIENMYLVTNFLASEASRAAGTSTHVHTVAIIYIIYCVHRELLRGIRSYFGYPVRNAERAKYTNCIFA